MKKETLQEESNLHDDLCQVVTMLKVGKTCYNDFGKFNYRTVEAIYQNIKPYLAKFNLVLTLTDSLEQLGTRTFLKATATISNGKESVSTNAYAEIDFSKKGMDLAQLTGSCSSYARKYALNGLLLLDDSKDIDSMKNETPIIAPSNIVEKLIKGFNAIGVTEEEFLAYLGNGKTINELDSNDLNKLRQYYLSIKR